MMYEMEKNLIKKGLVFTVIFLFVDVTVSSNFNVNIFEPAKAVDLPIKLYKFENGIVGIETSKAQIKPIAKQMKKFSVSPHGVAVFPGYHPTVASDSLGNVVLAFEYNTSIGFASSQDCGNKWSDQYLSMSIHTELPDVDSCGDGRFLGCLLPDYLDSTLYLVEITDPGLFPDGYECMSWDGDANFRSLAVAGYTDEEYPWMFGSCAAVCDKGNYTGIPLYFYKGFNYEIPCMFRVDLPQYITGCEVAADDIDLVTLHAYGVWNIFNSETGYKDIIGFIWDFGTWEQYGGEFTIHPIIHGYSINTTGNDDYLDVSAYNGNAIIVSQRDGDVVAYYSMDGMTTVNEASITTDAQNPRIIHNGNNTATCTFIKDNSVYYSKTRDGGATWSSPKRVDEPENSNVPEEYKAADVCGFGAAWMNSSDGFVYFADIRSQPNSPDIDGPNHGKPGVEYTYCINLSDPDNDGLFVLWDWGDGTNSGWLGPYGYEEVCASHAWNKKGTYIISVTVKDEYEASAKAYMEVTLPRNRVIDKPFARFFENHPLLIEMFQLLRW